MTTQIKNTLNSYITTEIMRQSDRQLADDEALISGGLVDSFSLVDLALFVEETYGIKIEDTELNADTFDSLDQLAQLIQSRQ